MAAAPRLRRRISPEELLELVPDGGALVRGHQIRCPGCEEWIDILAYRMLEFNETYARETVPVYRCPRHQCGHVFALDPNPKREVKNGQPPGDDHQEA